MNRCSRAGTGTATVGISEGGKMQALFGSQQAPKRVMLAVYFTIRPGLYILGLAEC